MKENTIVSNIFTLKSIPCFLVCIYVLRVYFSSGLKYILAGSSVSYCGGLNDLLKIDWALSRDIRNHGTITALQRIIHFFNRK